MGKTAPLPFMRLLKQLRRIARIFYLFGLGHGRRTAKLVKAVVTSSADASRTQAQRAVHQPVGHPGQHTVNLSVHRGAELGVACRDQAFALCCSGACASVRDVCLALLFGCIGCGQGRYLSRRTDCGAPTLTRRREKARRCAYE